MFEFIQQMKRGRVDDDDAPRRPSTAGWGGGEASEMGRLPVKTRSGRIVADRHAGRRTAPRGRVEASEDDGSDDDSALDTAAAAGAAAPKVATPKSEAAEGASLGASLLTPTQRYKRARVEIAELGMGIIEEPDKAVRSKGGAASLLQKLHKYCADDDARTRRIAMLSELAVFLDILPGYRIVLPTKAEEEESSTSLSREVRTRRAVERAMLMGYKHFVSTIKKTIRRQMGGASNSSKVGSLALLAAALSCATELLRSRADFNFNDQLLAVIVPLAARPPVGVPAKSVVDMCDAIAEMFRADTLGAVSFEAVSLIAKEVRSNPKAHHVAAAKALMRTLLSLPLGAKELRKAEMLPESKLHELTSKQSKKKKKGWRNISDDAKSEEQLQTEMAEAEATVEMTKRAAYQVSLLFTVKYDANRAHNLTRSP